MSFEPKDSRVEALLDRVGALLHDYVASAEDRDAPVVRFTGPEQLREAFRQAGVGLALDEPQAPLAVESLVRAVEQTLAHSVRTQHPRFFNQNFAGADPVAVLGDWLAAALNTTVATYEAAPVFTLMEQEVVKRLAHLAGLSPAEGVLNPGGSMSNLSALHLARHRAAPEVLKQGLHAAPRLVAFTSEQAHFSLERAMALAGMGRESLIKVPCDEAGRMRPDALEDAVCQSRARGERPFFLNATTGTTVLGAFDPLPELAEVARRHGLWLHVDGCHGASVLFSERHRHLMRGVEAADSLVWNPHKMLGITQQCSVLLVRHPGLLRECFSTKAAYLFQADKNHVEQDLGELSFLCARRADSLKLWLTWKARGDEGFAHRIDHAMELAAYTAARVSEDRRFRLAFTPSFSHVCFWWVPPDLRPLEDWRAPEVHARLHRLSVAIKDRMQRAGTMMIGYQPLAGRPNFFRLLFINPAVTHQDVDTTLDLLDRYGTEADATRVPTP
jgi:glutamate/tyrosine decarboxylase-like PLP-dependent enzyme